MRSSLIPVSLAAFTLSMMGTSFVSAQEFPDVHGNLHMYADAVDFVFEQGSMTGHPDGFFRPDDPLLRSEFSKVLSLLPGNTDEDCPGAEAQKKFRDVPATAWYAPYVCNAARKGFIRGYPDGTFGGGNRITFAEASAVLHRMLSDASTPTEQETSDDVAEDEENADTFGGTLPARVHPSIFLWKEGGSAPKDMRSLWFYEPVAYVIGQHAIPETVGGFDQPLSRGELAFLLHALLGGARGKDIQFADIPCENTEFAFASSLPVALSRPNSVCTVELTGPQDPLLLARIGSLPFLRSLSIRGAALTDVPETIFDLALLQELNMSENSIGSLPDLFHRLPYLEQLILNENQLTVLPDSIGSLTELSILHAESNSLTHLPETILSLPLLSELRLKDNALSTDTIDALSAAFPNIDLHLR